MSAISAHSSGLRVRIERVDRVLFEFYLSFIDGDRHGDRVLLVTGQSLIHRSCSIKLYPFSLTSIDHGIV